MEEMVAHKNSVWSAHRVFLRTGSEVLSVLPIIGTWTGYVLLGLVGTLFGRTGASAFGDGTTWQLTSKAVCRLCAGSRQVALEGGPYARRLRMRFSKS
jgi:hypothetical protein